MTLFKPAERSSKRHKPRFPALQRKDTMKRDERRLNNWRAVVDDEFMVHIKVK